MRALRTCLTGTLLALSFGSAVAQSAGHEQAMKIAQSGAETWMRTFDKHDAKAQSMLFVQDGVVLLPDGGPIAQGREEIERHWAELFKNIGGHETVTVRDAIPIGDDAVVAINDYKIVGDTKTLSGRASVVLAKTPDGWRTVAITPQSSPPPK